MRKNNYITIVAVIAAIVCLASAFLIKTMKGRTDIQSTTDAVIQTTVPSATEQVSTEAVTTTAKAPTTTSTTALPSTTTTTGATTTEAVVDETAEILKIVSDSINLLKSEKADFKGHKVQNIDMKLTDSSIPAMNDVANGIISLFIKEEIFDYDFTNGVSADPEDGGTISSKNAFPPENKPFSLTKEGVASAKKTKDGENTVYAVVIVPEKSTLQNPRPKHHNAGSDTLDLSNVEIPTVKINRVDFDYPGAEISVTIAPDGKVIGYHEHLRIIGTGEVSGLGMTGYGTIEGYIDEKWDIKWK